MTTLSTLKPTMSDKNHQMRFKMVHFSIKMAKSRELVSLKCVRTTQSAVYKKDTV